MQEKKNQEISDLYKEVLIILSNASDEIIEKIPDQVFDELNKLAADSEKDFYIDMSKDIDEQNISKDAKNLISLIYYNYITDENDKKEIYNEWEKNEKIHKENLKEKYNKILEHRKNEECQDEPIHLENNELTKKDKIGIVSKIKNAIKKLFNKHSI